MDRLIILSTDIEGHNGFDGIFDIQDWLKFHNVSHELRQFWSDDHDCYNLGDLEHSVVIAHYNLLSTMVKNTKQVDIVVEFLSRNNQIWMVGIDSVALTYPDLQSMILALDQQVHKNSLILLLEATPTDRSYLSHLQNIQIVERPSFHVQYQPRFKGASSKKINPHYDFLLTMIRQPGRPHRDRLWRELNKRSNLIDRGLVSANVGRTNKWLGEPDPTKRWSDGHASMDLYLDCYLEIVPETCYRDLWFMTEKTRKPIVTQTPFLMVSTAGYLAWLHSQGFKTFDGLISEQYDVCWRLEDRVRLMLDQLQDIINNGTKDFYMASQPILEYNFARLCELSGAWRWQFDQAMWQLLEQNNN
jgi:hypothetical protein